MSGLKRLEQKSKAYLSRFPKHRPYYCNAGKPWTKKALKSLKRLVAEKTPLAVMSMIHGRSKAVIQRKLREELGIRRVSIKFSHFWVPVKVPLFTAAEVEAICERLK